VVNVTTSPSRAPKSEVVLQTLAGPEIGVASTKAFTCLMMVLAALSIAAGRARGELSAETEGKLVRNLVEVPRLMGDGADLVPQIERLARDIAKSRDVPLSRTRHQLSAGAGRRAQAQGNLIHPCRGLCRRRAESMARSP